MLDLHVISLARTPARRERFARLNAHLPFEFHDAVDGREASEQLREDRSRFGPDLPYVAGAFGAACSHLARWEDCIRLGRPITVAEDDAIFRHDFAAAHRSALATIGARWDVVLWGWNLDYYLSLRFIEGVSTALVRFDPSTFAGAIPAFQAGTETARLLRLHRVWGVPAYSISPAGAAALKRRCFPIQRGTVDLPIAGLEVPNVGIDGAMNLAFDALDAWVAMPPLALSENDQATSTSQLPARRKGPLSRTWKGIKTRLRGSSRTMR